MHTIQTQIPKSLHQRYSVSIVALIDLILCEGLLERKQSQCSLVLPLYPLTPRINYKFVRCVNLILRENLNSIGIRENSPRWLPSQVIIPEILVH